MSTFNPYQSGGATKTVVTPNFSTYSLASGYANFTPAGQAPPPPPPGSFRGPPGPGPQGPRGNGGGGGGFGRPKRPFGYDGMGYKNRMQWMAKNPDKVTRHHCEVCCCDCLGRDSWKAHLKGQQHLKKLRMAEQQGKLSASASAMLSGGGEEGEISEPGGEFTSTYRAPTVNTGPPPPNFCEICNCNCTNSDAFAAHLRGQKHQRSLKLHQKMGKAIPSSLQPQVVKVIPKTSFTTGGTLITGQV